MDKGQAELAQALADNRPRFRPGRDGVESWFIRANAPDQARAFWLKVTNLTRAGGASVAEVWCSVFDGERTGAWRLTIPLEAATLGPIGADGLPLRVGGVEWTLGSDGGMARGALENEGREVRWEIAFERVPGLLGDPMCLLPSRGMVDGAFPRSKLLTPFPVARFRGEVVWDGEVWPVDGWTGMQGHNWGDAHAPEYAWGQCVFSDPTGRVLGVVEGASGRIAIGPWTSPRISLLGVRYGGRELRFDRLVNLWAQHPSIAFPEWTLRIAGPGGEAVVAMRGDARRMVCLGYDNPVAPRRYCLNSKTAAVTLRVNPSEGDAFELTSAHGGALEFLAPEARDDVQPVV